MRQQHQCNKVSPFVPACVRTYVCLCLCVCLCTCLRVCKCVFWMIREHNTWALQGKESKSDMQENCSALPCVGFIDLQGVSDPCTRRLPTVHLLLSLLCLRRCRIILQGMGEEVAPHYNNIIHPVVHTQMHCSVLIPHERLFCANVTFFLDRYGR